MKLVLAAVMAAVLVGCATAPEVVEVTRPVIIPIPTITIEPTTP